MSIKLAKNILSVDFDGTWETLVSILSKLLDEGEEWISRQDEHHTTQVLTILVSFRSVAETFGCVPSENPLLADRYYLIANWLLKWFEAKMSNSSSSAANEWNSLVEITKNLLVWA